MKTSLDTTLAHSRLVRTGTLEPLSEGIIPAVPNEFYAYPSIFTDSRSLYALMKCKANKARIVSQARELGREAHLFFQFDRPTDVRVVSTKSAQAMGLLGTDIQFDDVWVSPTNVAIEDFYTLCARRNSADLADICRSACNQRITNIRVEPGVITAVMTSAGKYGLFLPKELTPTSVSIEACHVLLT